MNNQEQAIIEVENKYWTDMYKALERLHSNPDFEQVILKGYFQDRAVNGVSMLANRGVIEGNKRGQIMEELVAVSHLQDFFITVTNLGSVPEATDDSDELS